jgi:hypothetical protein
MSNSGDIQKTTVEHPSEAGDILAPDASSSKEVVSKDRDGVLLFLAITFLIFIAITWMGLDLVSSLGLDSLVGQKYAAVYTIVRISANLLLAATALGAAVAWISIVNREDASKDNSGRKSKEAAAGRKEPEPPNTNPAKSPVSPEIAPQSRIEPSEIEQVLDNIDRRLGRLSRQSTLIYASMNLSLLAGVILIIFAGALSSWDTTLSNVTAQIESQRQEALKQLAFGNATSSDSIERLKRLDELYNHAVDAVIKQVTEKADNKPAWNWPVTILRVGIIGMLVFLTQILISLYRYNSRLIAFYSSRRNGLILANNRKELKLEHITTLLFPSDLDFGREPRHPFLEMMAFFRRGKLADPERQEMPVGGSKGGRNRKATKSTSTDGSQHTAGDE